MGTDEPTQLSAHREKRHDPRQNEPEGQRQQAPRTRSQGSHQAPDLRPRGGVTVRTRFSFRFLSEPGWGVLPVLVHKVRGLRPAHGPQEGGRVSR